MAGSYIAFKEVEQARDRVMAVPYVSLGVRSDGQCFYSVYISESFVSRS